MNVEVLKLTGIVQPGGAPNVYVGRIKEISGIISQGETEEEAFDQLKDMVPHVIKYKREEALNLLAKQLGRPTIETNVKLEFDLAKDNKKSREG